MKVLVDTSVWSMALRRHQPARDDASVAELGRLVSDFRIAMIGPIRQELLSGIRELKQYQSLREKLRAFPDLRLETADYELAAQFFNDCRGKGIQGSNTDFLMCAFGHRRDMPIFTADKDFDEYSRVLEVKLYRTLDR